MSDDKIANLLEELANKLGTTMEHLWNILMHQAYIEAFKNIMLIALFIIAGILTLRYTIKYNKGKSIEDIDNDFGSIAVIILSIVISVFTIAIIVCFVPETVDAIFNPEYWALNHILKLIR
jgi:flagellar biosynthesis protein FlhB